MPPPFFFLTPERLSGVPAAGGCRKSARSRARATPSAPGRGPQSHKGATRGGPRCALVASQRLSLCRTKQAGGIRGCANTVRCHVQELALYKITRRGHSNLAHHCCKRVHTYTYTHVSARAVKVPTRSARTSVLTLLGDTSRTPHRGRASNQRAQHAKTHTYNRHPRPTNIHMSE